jgi:hypothetical protein
MRRLFAFVSFLFSGFLVVAQEGVSARLDKNQILIGEKMELTLEATLPPSVNGWFALDSIPHFEILERSAIDTTAAIAGRRLKQTLTITSWDSGRWVIPPLSLLRFRTRPIQVDVGHSLMDYNQPYHDIKDIMAVQKPRKSNWYWYLVGIAVLIALFMLFFPPKKKDEKEVPDVDVYPDSIRRLDQLDPAMEPKLFYTELVHVLRNYLTRRKGISSFSQTTVDLSLQIKKLNLPEEVYTPLVQTLRLSDVVKYAKYMPGIDENRAALTTVRSAIQKMEGRG